MEDRVFEYWAATIQDGYIGNLVELVERAGGAKNLYNMSAEKMIPRLGITKRMADHILKAKEGVDIEKNYYKMMENGIFYVNHKDNDFPKKLLDIASCPYGLFVKGALPDENKKSVAIVGARECTEYGRLMAEYLGDRLARQGINIISGMAWGIDGIAQMAAVQAGGKSYGVLGCGPDVVYPRKNIGLYEKLIENGNGIISEYAPGMAAQSKMFPPRNRIIAGLCDVLVVVEARAKSGTLITVEMAIDQGKTIMVVPGRITDPLSVGCLNLIKEGAIPITSYEDVVEAVFGHTSIYQYEFETINEDSINTSNLSDMEIRVYDFLTIDPQSAETIADKVRVPLDEALILLTNLEMKSLVKECGQFNFVKNMTLT